MRVPDLAETARLWLILAMVDARLGILPGAWNRAWLFSRPGSASSAPGPATLARLARLMVLLRVASRFRLRSSSPCLCLALALRARLAPLGLRPRLVYGSRRRPGSCIDAHAWLVLGGAMLDPLGSASSFEPFDSAR